MLNFVKSRYSGKSGIIIFSLILALTSTELLYSQQWFEDTSGVTVQLNSVVCFQQNRAWCCGNSGTVLKSRPLFFQNQRWINVSGNGIPDNIDLINIACSNDTNIAITTGTLGNTSYVYRTTNAGANWVQVFSQVNGHINSIWFKQFPDSIVFMQGNPVGGRWSLWKSTNRGLSWDSTGLYLPQSGTEAGLNNSMNCYEDRIWFGTNNSRIYYSSNFGTNWSAQSTSPEINIYTIRSNPGYSLTLAGGSTLLRSSNFGISWVSNSSMGSGNFGGLACVFTYWWYVRSDNKIYMSSNNGSSWVVQYTAPAGNYTNIYLSNNFNIFMYAVRTNGGISKYYIMVGIKQISSEVPEEFKLYPNYPNPFNPETIIKFKIKDSRFTTLKVYDILGKEIESLVNEQLNPGTYEVNWNAAEFSSGIYYYRLTAGSFTETRKMILIK